MALNSLLPATPITVAAANVLTQVLDLKASGQKLPMSMAAQVALVYGSGGTTVDVYIQTSLDGGVTWCDVMNFHFTTASLRAVGAVSRQPPAVAAGVPAAATDGSMSSNTKSDGIFGQKWRAKYTSTGTYAGTTLQIDLVGEN